MAKRESKRLNDTAAVVMIPAFNPETSESQSRDVRKIENGYIVRTSSHRDGRYESSETYVVSPGQSVESNPMARAVDYMKREGSI